MEDLFDSEDAIHFGRAILGLSFRESHPMGGNIIANFSPMARRGLLCESLIPTPIASPKSRSEDDGD